MNDSVGFPTSLLDDHDFIVTMARYAEGTIRKIIYVKNTVYPKTCGNNSARTILSSKK
jgi:hypothetical protein